MHVGAHIYGHERAARAIATVEMHVAHGTPLPYSAPLTFAGVAAPLRKAERRIRVRDSRPRTLLALVLKLTLAPALVAVATLAAKRSGPRTGGLIAGLPIVAGPIALVVAIEQGTRFAHQAAIATVLGMLSTVAFCLAYATAAQRDRAPFGAALFAAILAYTATTVVLLQIHLELAAAAAVTLLAVTAGAWQLGRLGRRATVPRAPVRNLLPIRMAVTALLVVTITGAAGHLSAHAAGLLVPIPIVTPVMASFTHAQAGPVAATRLLAGLLQALVAFLAFFVVLAVALPAAGVVGAYALASTAALAVWLALVTGTRARAAVATARA